MVNYFSLYPPPIFFLLSARQETYLRILHLISFKRYFLFFRYDEFLRFFADIVFFAASNTLLQSLLIVHPIYSTCLALHYSIFLLHIFHRCLFFFQREFGFSDLNSVNCSSQETEVTSTPTRPVDNVVIATKGLQDKKNKYNSWDDGGK